MSAQLSSSASHTGEHAPKSKVPPEPTEIPQFATPSGDLELSHLWGLLRNMQEQLVSLQEQNTRLEETIGGIETMQLDQDETLEYIKSKVHDLHTVGAIHRPKTPPQGPPCSPEETPRPATGTSSQILSPTPIRAKSLVAFAGLGSPLVPKHRTPSPAISAAAPRRTSTPTIAPPTTSKPPKMKEPESFDGVRGRSAKQWWTRVVVWASFQCPNYPTEVTMLLHILTLMKPGKAADWAQPIMEKIVARDPSAPDTMEELSNLFNTAFADPDASRAAMRQLHNLTQTSDANAYTTEFNNLASDLDWSDEAALKAQYEQGLSFRVKLQLIQCNPYPQTLAALQEAAIKIDSLYRELDLSNPRRKAQGPAEEKSKAQGGTERKCEGLSLEERKKLPNYVSEEERKAQREGSLCIKCGSPDHMFRDCKNGWRKERVPGKGKTKETAKVVEESESEKE